MKVEKLSENRVRYTFDVTPEEFEHGLDYAFDRVKDDVEVKGFRKGQVPRRIYDAKFGVETLYEQAINHVLMHKYHEALQDPDHEIVGEPKIDLDVQEIKQGNPFEVRIETAIKPQVTLGNYKGVTVAVEKKTVKDADVDAKIQEMLRKDATLEPKEGTLEKGDTAIFDFEGFLDGEPFEGGKAENYELEIGSNAFIPGFEDQMIGMKAGEEADINVTFPEKYQAENLAGKDVVFRIKLHEIKTKKPEALNDEWVKKLEREGIETVEQLKEQIKKELIEQREQETTKRFNNDVIARVIEAASVDIPKEMIDQETENYLNNIKEQAKQYGMDYEMFLSLSGTEPKAFEENARKEAFKRVEMSLIFEAIADTEGIEPSEEEIEAKYKELAEHHKMSLEEVKSRLSKEALANDLATTLAYQFVIDNAIKE
ncbi:MAG: trigger factor [Acholeplasmataceae bacterium]